MNGELSKTRLHVYNLTRVIQARSTHPAKVPPIPLRRIIQGLDPKRTVSLIAKAQCPGEKRIGGGGDCFVLKVLADQAAVMERNEGPAEVMRHILYEYFCQKSGLLLCFEDSHLTRVQSADSDEAVYRETTIGSSIGECEDVDGLLTCPPKPIKRLVPCAILYDETQHSGPRKSRAEPAE